MTTFLVALFVFVDVEAFLAVDGFGVFFEFDISIH